MLILINILVYVIMLCLNNVCYESCDVLNNENTVYVDVNGICVIQESENKNEDQENTEEDGEDKVADDKMKYDKMNEDKREDDK